VRFLIAAGFAALAMVSAGLGQAADMLVKAPPIAPVPPFNWAGPYIGGGVGYGWGEKSFADQSDLFLVSSNTTLSDPLRGWLGGIQIGWNYQVTPVWVVGIEGDLYWTDISGSATSPFGIGTVFNARTEWIDSATGRVGYSWDRWLPYVKGGAAWVHDKYSATNSLGTWSASETRAGWTIGAGLEWAFAANWSVRLEYDFYEFGTRGVTFVPISLSGGASGAAEIVVPGNQNEMVKQDIQTIMFGVNYRFGTPGPISTRG
jgi:outer membrane immunogenic protein